MSFPPHSNNNMKKRILYLGGFELPDKNAAAQRVMTNAKLLREMGYEVIFMGISKDIAHAPQMVDGFESRPIAYATSVKEWLKQVITFVKTDEILKLNPEYVILYNFPAIASLRILKACHQHAIKVIHDITEWESATNWSPREVVRKIDIFLRMSYCIKKMDGVIAISRYLYNYYQQHTRTILIPPLVDLTDKKWNRERTLTASTPFRLIYAGSAGYGTKDKLDFIVDALKDIPQLHLDVVGMTKEEYIKGYGHFPNGCNHIKFHGRISHTETVKMVQDADFQLLIREKSRKNDAGFPTKLVESISCCTPLIATLTSNIGDYLKNEVNGYIVSNEQSLKDILRKLTKIPPESVIKMKEACRQLTCFDYRNSKDSFQQIFK